MKYYNREGWLLSVAFHAAIATAAILGLPSLRRELPDVPDMIPVDYVEISEATRAKDTKPVEPAAREAEIPVIRQEAPQRQELADAVPMPDPPAQKQPAPKPDVKPEPPQPKIRVAPRTKPSPPSRFDPGKLSALIDKSVKKDVAPTRKSEQAEKTETKAAPTPMSASIASATLQEAIRQKVQECWFVPAGARDVANMSVRILILLRQDGRLLRPPQFVDVGDLSSPGREFYRTFAESARRAVQNCEPYDMLPAENYDLWRQVEFNFDASDMLGG